MVEAFGQILHSHAEVTNHHVYLMNTLNLAHRESCENPFMTPKNYPALSWAP